MTLFSLGLPRRLSAPHPGIGLLSCNVVHLLQACTALFWFYMRAVLAGTGYSLTCAVRMCPATCVVSVQASQCFVLDLDQRAFLAAVKDRKAAGMAPVPATDPHMNPAADNSSRLSSGPIVVDPATYFGSSTSSGFSNSSWPVGQNVLDFFWGELTLSDGAPFECLTPDGKSTVSIQAGPKSGGGLLLLSSTISC
jgi:hypothetical protein